MHTLKLTRIFTYLCLGSYFVLCVIINNEKEVDLPSNQTIQELTKEIDKIADNLVIRTTASDIVIALDKLENKLMNATAHFDQSGKRYVRLIFEGVKSKILNETKFKEITSEENAAKEIDVNENTDLDELVAELSLKIESLIENELNQFNKTETSRNKVTNPVNQNVILQDFLNLNKSRRMNEHETDFKNPHDRNPDVVDNGKLGQNFDNINNYMTSNEQNILPFCHYFINRTCEDIKNINRLKCRYEQSYITLDKLCDGVPDCPFESDENNCYSQVKEQFLYVKQVESYIDSSRYSKCLEFDVSRSVLTNQARTVRNVLDKEFNYIKKYKYLNSSLHNLNNVSNNNQIKNVQEEMANSIALVISSLALALDGAICSNKQDNFDTRRSNDFFDIDLDKEVKKSLLPPEGCKCNKGSCSYCTHYCKHICKQKYSLTNWNCDSLNGSSTIPLNMLCDGKLDCFDGSDETGCNTGTDDAKFEASEIYSNILDMLQLKASYLREPIQKKFILLGESITRLQELTMNTVPKLEKIKKLRDNCYLMLRIIYTDILKVLDIGKEPEEAYLFLLSVNENLGTALKRSHTGNAKIMGNRCHCRNGTCSISYCSKVCLKACAVEPKLTRYYCQGKTHKTVSIEKICDGIQDCGNGYDEFNCKKDEICRPHHLVVLRHNLQSIGDNLKGTALGELLLSWKSKVISTLKVLEKTTRPTPQALQNVVNDILKDLVFAYGSFENYRRNNVDYALGVFLTISRIILESIKTCGK